MNDLRTNVQPWIGPDSNAVNWAVAVERGKLADELTSNWNVVDLIVWGSHVVGRMNILHCFLYMVHVHGLVTKRTAR